MKKRRIAVDAADPHGIRIWNKRHGRMGAQPHPETHVLRELRETGLRTNHDWDVVYHPRFDRWCLIERPWRQDGLWRQVAELYRRYEALGALDLDGNHKRNGWSMRRFFDFLWQHGMVKWPLVIEDVPQHARSFAGPRELNQRDVTRMCELREKGDLVAMQQHNERLDKFTDGRMDDRLNDMGTFMKKGYRYTRSSGTDLFCPHNMRSKKCPVCNPKVGYVGRGRREHATDNDLVTLGLA